MTAPGGGKPGQQFGGDLLTEIFENSLDPGYADAAAGGHKSGPWGVAGRVLALAAIGFLLAVAYLKVVADAPDATKTREKLVSDIKRDQASADELESRTVKLRAEVAGMRDRALADAGGDAKYLRDLEAITGLGPVRGAGIVVTVGDASDVVDPVTGKPKAQAQGKVYDRDIQRIVNALWASGAEAVAINDQRLAGTSTIRKAGGAILVDFKPVSGPYRIAAIGPDDLEKRFNGTAAARQFKGYVGQYGMVFEVKAASKLSMASAADPQLRYARPVPSPSPSPSPSVSGSGGVR
ncbi:DUF881 domain-containing protein [Longispora albida]|uniref:DUF881 domain-containing protein n=1 Tax=Longispora albida TaxID=203523 RepID=UPI00036609CB|nr:DUF881 domain-containing protein [Longispora albida]